MRKNNEYSLLFIVLIIAGYYLFFNKFSFINIFLSFLTSFIFINIFKKLDNNKFINIILIIICLVIRLFVLYNSGLFIRDVFLNNYNLFIILLSFSLVSLYFTKLGLNTYIKVFEVSLFFIFIIGLLSTLLLIPSVNLDNIYFIKDSFNYNFILYSLFISLIYILIKNIFDYKFNFKFFYSSFIYIFLSRLFFILVIGNKLFEWYSYPIIKCYSKIRYLNFFERMEGIISIKYLFLYFLLFNFLNVCIVKMFFNLKEKNL